MRNSWATAIVFGLVAASGSANAVVITPVSAVLNAHARSTSGLVVAAPLIVGATYGEFSNSAESIGDKPFWGDSAHADIHANIQPDELRLSGTARASVWQGGPYAGASALVEFEVSASSEWLLYVAGFDWADASGSAPRLELSNSSGTVYLFNGNLCVVCDVHGCTICDVRLTLAPGLYSLEAVVETGVWFGPMAGQDLQASLRPVPSVVPIPATFGSFGPDLLMFGLICVFVVLRPAWHTRRARA